MTETEAELDFWCQEYPDLTREEIAELLAILDEVELVEVDS